MGKIITKIRNIPKPFMILDRFNKNINVHVVFILQISQKYLNGKTLNAWVFLSGYDTINMIY